MDTLLTMALPINLKEGEATSTIYGMVILNIVNIV